MKISYEFVTGEKVELEVPDTIGKVSIEIDKQIYNINRKETRRHNSINDLEEEGVQFADVSSNVEEVVEDNERHLEINEAINTLLPEQKELIEKVFFQNMKIVDIARASGVTESAIRNRLKKIFKKMRKNLK